MRYTGTVVAALCIAVMELIEQDTHHVSFIFSAATLVCDAGVRDEQLDEQNKRARNS